MTPSVQAATLVWGTGVWGNDSWGTGASSGNTSTAPTTLSGSSFNGQSDPAAGSSASFAIGLSRDNGAMYVSTASVNDTVRVIGFITPESQQLGQLADIFVVDRVNLVTWFMKNLDGLFVTWDTRVPNLVPVREDVPLTANVQVDIFTGKLGTAGDHRFFLGYMAADGKLRYTPSALRLTISP